MKKPALADGFFLNARVLESLSSSPSPFASRPVFVGYEQVDYPQPGLRKGSKPQITPITQITAGAEANRRHETICMAQERGRGTGIRFSQNL
jgi:hypothetical protein